jgi:hypothetical protein
MRTIYFCVAITLLASCSQATFVQRAADACVAAGFEVGTENYERCVLRGAERERATVANTFTNLGVGFGQMSQGRPVDLR